MYKEKRKRQAKKYETQSVLKSKRFLRWIDRFKSKTFNSEPSLIVWLQWLPTPTWLNQGFFKTKQYFLNSFCASITHTHANTHTLTHTHTHIHICMCVCLYVVWIRAILNIPGSNTPENGGCTATYDPSYQHPNKINKTYWTLLDELISRVLSKLLRSTLSSHYMMSRGPAKTEGQ